MDETEARKCLESLLQIESGLSDWEVEFIESCSKRRDYLSDKQIDKIAEMYDMYCAGNL